MAMVVASRVFCQHADPFCGLEGLDRKVWEPEIEAARQNWRLLAEQAGTAAEKTLHQEDLEAAVRLARMEMADLQGLPLPSE